jgi:hypothetical protein
MTTPSSVKVAVWLATGKGCREKKVYRVSIVSNKVWYDTSDKDTLCPVVYYSGASDKGHSNLSVKDACFYPMCIILNFVLMESHYQSR